MNYKLLTFSIITKRDMRLRYFVSDKDWYEELHSQIEYNMYDRREMEEAIADLGLEEIAFDEIQNYTFADTMEIAVYDGFDVYNTSDIPHYRIEFDSNGCEALFYGHMRDRNFKDDEAFDVDDIVGHVIEEFDGTYNPDADKVYLVPKGESCDGDYALVYCVFSNEKDADLYLSLFENGEVAPYVFINDAYHWAIENHPTFRHVKFIFSNELLGFLETKSVVLKRPFFAGLDIYN